jgi:hypothetical protein
MVQAGEVKKWNYPALSKERSISSVPGLLITFE